MNSLFPEHLEDLNRRKIEQDRTFILKEEMLNGDSELSILLDKLGDWMIANGKVLHERYSKKAKPRSLALLQDTSKIFRA